MKKILPFFLLACLIILPTKTNAQEMVTVKLVKDIGNVSTLEMKVCGDYFSLDPTITLKEGVKYQLSVNKGRIYLKGDGKSEEIKGPIYLIPGTYHTSHSIEINGKPYLGAIEFRIEDATFIRPVNQLPVEDYLKGVVPFEVFPTWNIETLKAQALAARTYTYSHLGEEMTDTVQYQVYGGYEWFEKATKAVEETANEVITYDGKLIEAFYSASNGGVTENNANVWGGKPLAYFPIKEDQYDPSQPWEFPFHQLQYPLEGINWDNTEWWDGIKVKDEEVVSTITKWLNRNGYPGDIKILSIPTFELSNQLYKSKRYKKGSITLEFLHRLYDGTVMYEQLVLNDIQLNQIRPMFGGSTFKSYLIDTLTLEDGSYKVTGKGYGHGVGMSQWGANIMGESGKTYTDIIQFYFPGTKVIDVSQK